MITILPVFPDRAEQVQEVFNHKDIIGWLGGFTMLEQLRNSCKDKYKIGLFGAFLDDGTCVGGIQVAARPSSWQMKWGQVGVLPEYRRQRISTALYAAVTMQAILEGRRLLEDSIVSNNPVQFTALPTMGIKLVGTLRHRTTKGHGLALFDFTLLDRLAFPTMISRIPQALFQIRLQESFYTDEVFQKNLEVFRAAIPAYEAEAIKFKQLVKQELTFVTVERLDMEHPTDARRRQFSRKSLIQE